jgi:RND family efflux transporter MFP subunit
MQIVIAGALVALALAIYLAVRLSHGPAVATAPPNPPVTVSLPISKKVASQTSFLGQFAAVEAVEIRAQVGGVLTEIHFQDGQIVKKGDLLFVIDPRPFEIALATANAAVKTAQAQIALAQAQLWRAQQLKRSDYGTAETVDQRAADLSVANAALDTANSNVRNAQLDLDYSRVKAPFTGRVSSHRVSVGNLVSGSREGTSPTTLLTTIVSVDPIWLNFDMSENEYLEFARNRTSAGLSEPVNFRLGDETQSSRHGTLDFIDNAIDRGSGTIHARVTASNPDGFLIPGTFARLVVSTGQPQDVLLVPETALSLDQSNRVLMTVADDNTIVAKTVTVGDLHEGMRVIKSGLAPTDHVIVEGLQRAMPGQKVTPQMQQAASR